ncbi:hypothetical protein [Chryseobacterium sp.]|uniref:hypothetical protein n=1 Tax=Chryseobacterium sp. TaxID=1871047 RepID=UPI0025BF2559|nr:hypothetical protein [Chryseobacterium sp.]
MKKFYFVLIPAALFLTSCSNDDLSNSMSNSEQVSATEVINQSGRSGGVVYNLKNVEVNPNLVKISSENTTIISPDNEMQDGRFSFTTQSKELIKKLVAGNIIYVKTEDHTYLRTITGVVNNNNTFSLNTSEAHIGDLFSGGSLELSIDTQAAEQDLASKNHSLLKAKDYNNSFTYDIFTHIPDYTAGGLTLSPNTSVTSTLNVNMGFGSSKILPNALEVYYQINSGINPSIAFSGAVNQKYKYDLINNVPSNLLDLLKSVEIEVNIPTGDFLGDIPAKISIDQVNFPMSIEANVSKASKLAFNANGTFKVGFAYYNNVPGKTNHFIYENTMTSTGVAEADLAGEVATDMAVVIKPKVSLLDTNLISVNSDISFGVNTYSNGYAGTSQAANFSSEGNFYSKASFSFSSLGITLYKTDLFNENQELWKIGNFNTAMTLSNFRATKTSILPCSGLNSYNYGITLDYKYPILGKVMSGDLEVTYDVYADNGTLLSQKTVTVTPSNITANSFTFNLCVPFRQASIFSIAKTTYLRNITVKDANGYTASGIIDPATGNPYNQLTLTR